MRADVAGVENRFRRMVEGREEAKEEAKGRKRVDVRTCTYKTMGRTGEDEKKGEKDEVAR